MTIVRTAFYTTYNANQYMYFVIYYFTSQNKPFFFLIFFSYNYSLTNPLA